MRVSTRLLFEGTQERIDKIYEELSSINEKMASGKAINRPSDNPIAVIDSMGLKTSLSQIEQYQRNIDYGMSWLRLRESTLTQLGDLVARAHEISVQMGNDTQSAETRLNAATEIDDLLDQAIALGNTELGGNYIFAGYKNKTSPFLKAVIGGIETAQYQGDTNDIQVRLAKDDTLVIGKNGQSTLADSNVFTALGTLKKALEENDGDAIRQQLDQLKNVSDYLDNEVGNTGAKANRLDVRKSSFTVQTENLKERLSTVEDVDMAEMMTELNEKQLAYQAALMASVRVSQISILNYLS